MKNHKLDTCYSYDKTKSMEENRKIYAAKLEEKDILFDVEEEHVLLEGVGGHKSMSKEYGDSIFGKTRILKNRVGSVLVSNYSTRKLYQVTNPDEDTFILRGWKNNPITAGKTWQFVRDEERYGDKLLHCTVKIEQAKSFVSKETKFYRPERVPIANDSEEEIIGRVQEMHEQLSHASSYAMIRVIVADPKAFNVTIAEIKLWKEKSGKHCTGCIEGAMKQHAKIDSTKPLTSEVPGELSAGDLMFIETKAETKKLLLLNVDVVTKLLTGVSIRGKDEDECTNAILQVKAEYAIYGRKM